MHPRFGYSEIRARLRVLDYGMKTWNYTITIHDAHGYDILQKGVRHIFV